MEHGEIIFVAKMTRIVNDYGFENKSNCVSIFHYFRVCFDEFNRIETDVLSVVAQQILTIYRSIGFGHTTFLFEGITLQLDPTCAIFITMSSNIIQKTELP